MQPLKVSGIRRFPFGGNETVFLALGLAVGAASANAPAPSSPEEATLHVTAQVDFGPDVGQHFGSLFEVRDKQGRVVMGAGFADVYNTLFRAHRHTLQFFVRPQDDGNQFTLERLPRPTEDYGVYLFDLDGKLYAWSYTHDKTVRVWNEATQTWEAALGFDGDNLRFGDGPMRVGDGLLWFTQGRVEYQGQLILAPPAEGEYHNFYYAQGHLIFFHRKPGPEGDSARLVACPWSAGREAPADLTKAHALPLKYARETPFAFGQWRQEVLTCSNLGGLYAFDGRDWKTLREPNDQVSYQIYSMVNYYDRLLMAHYPSGVLYAYDGQNVTPLEGWPPVPEGVSRSVREAQTTMIYGGDLYVGVWPWAELWRYDAERWISMGRLFTHPPLTDQVNHPYEKEINDFNAAHGTHVVENAWGQRVASMVPMGEALMISTSAKGPEKRETRFEFLTDEVYQEYGQVVRLKRPGNLAATLRWKGQPTQLEFILTRNRMSVRQDGELLASADLDPKMTVNLQPAHLTWGYGVFGPLQGTLKSQSVAPAVGQ